MEQNARGSEASAAVQRDPHITASRVARETLRFSRLCCEEPAEPLKSQFSGRLQETGALPTAEFLEFAESAGENFIFRGRDRRAVAQQLTTGGIFAKRNPEDAAVPRYLCRFASFLGAALAECT